MKASRNFRQPVMVIMKASRNFRQLVMMIMKACQKSWEAVVIIMNVSPKLKQPGGIKNRNLFLLPVSCKYVLPAYRHILFSTQT
jgi:hypothetical protein